MHIRDFFVYSGAEIQPHSQWNLGDFFPNFDFFLEDCDTFFKIGIFIQSSCTDATW